ncbi:putative serine protease (plasmid) [Nostoc sp. NIES-2111]|nr:putative serine protease [Nostoc sp. NIES-2111]
MKLHFQTGSLLSIFASINGFNQAVIALQPEIIYQKANPAVVAIIALQNRQPVSYGSGVIISPRGWIVTANHVVANQRNVSVKVLEKVYRGAVVARDPNNDLALIKLQSQQRLPSLRLQSIPPKIGQKIYVLGNPLTLEKSFTDGIVSRLDDNGVIQYTAPTNPGNSGGPLLNENGEVIGVVSRGVPVSRTGSLAPGIYFAIPTSKIQILISRMRPASAEARQSATYHANGLIQAQKGNYRRAIEYYNQAIRLEPRNANTYVNRANAQLKLKNYRGAVEDYAQAIQINPNLSGAYYNRGSVYQFLKDKNKALQDYDLAIRINRNWGNGSIADAYYRRGLVRLDLGDNKSALIDFQAAADLYSKQGKTAEYQQTLNQIIKLNPRSEIDK